MLLEALALEKQADKWAVDTVHDRDNGTAFAAAILRGEAKAVSDGSFKNEQGTSASILFHSSSKDPNRIVSVTVPYTHLTLPT